MATLQLYLDDDDPWVIEQKIFNVLNDYLQPNSHIPPPTAAQAIDDLFPTNRKDDDGKEDSGSFLWHLWSRFHKTVQQISHADPGQEKLAALVKALSLFSSKASPVYLASWSAEYRLWGDLPMFGPTFREEMDDIGTDTGHARQRNRNLNAYAARLLRDGTVNLTLFAIQALAAALEGRAVYSHAHATRFQTDSSFTPGPALDCEVAIAADWVLLCGEKLLRDERVSGGVGGPLWNGETGLSMERWGLWKERFAGVGLASGVSEETRRVALRARESMDEVEKRTST